MSYTERLNAPCAALEGLNVPRASLEGLNAPRAALEGLNAPCAALEGLNVPEGWSGMCPDYSDTLLRWPQSIHHGMRIRAISSVG